MSHCGNDCRFYSLYGALSGTATYAAGLLFSANQSAQSIIVAPVLGGVYGISKAVALKGFTSLLPLKNKDAKIWALAQLISSYVFASGCMFFASQALYVPLTFKAALILGLGFEYIGGMLLTVACMSFGIGTVALHKLGIIDACTVNTRIKQWTANKDGNSLLAYFLMNKIINDECKTNFAV